MSNAPHHVPHDELEAIIREHATVRGGLLPALHALQHRVGFVPRELIPALADAFNIGVAEVHGVISFYHDFRTEPPKGTVVHVCRAEACQARGGREVWESAQSAAIDQAIEVREVFCLGNCALGPSVSVSGRLHCRVSAEAARVWMTSGLPNWRAARMCTRKRWRCHSMSATLRSPRR